MIEPGFATMLCFVQTDAEVADPDAAPARARSRGSFERITVDGQMSTNDTVLLQATGAAGAAAAGRACSTRCCSSSRSRSSPTARARPGSAGSRCAGAADAGRGRAGRAGDRQLAAGQDGALRPRPELGPDRPGGGHGAGRARSSRSSAPTRSTPPSWARTPARGRDRGRPRPRRRRGARLLLRPHATTTSSINAEYTT